MSGRLAKIDCLAVFDDAHCRKYSLIGQSDLAEIRIICGPEADIAIGAFVDRRFGSAGLAGVRLRTSLHEIADQIDAVVIIDLVDTELQWAAAVECFGEARVLIPELLESKIDASRVPA